MIRLRHLIQHDFWLKLFSLVIAVLVWFAVSFAIRNQVPLGANIGHNLEEKDFPGIPVVILSSASDVHEFKVLPKEVNVTVRGAPAVLRNLQSKDIRALVDLTGVTETTEMRKRIEVSTPAGVTHVKVMPDEVKIFQPKPDAAKS